jgi:hypothetical protein
MLADEGLIVADEANGRKTYALTDAGRAEAEASADRPAPGRRRGQRDGGRMSALPKAGFALAQAVGQVGRTGTPEQVQQRRRDPRRGASPRLRAARPGLIGVPSGSRARYRRILRFAALSLAQTWWYDLFLPRVGCGRLAERSRSARLQRIARRFHALAVDLGGLMIKVGQFMSSRLDVLPPEIRRSSKGCRTRCRRCRSPDPCRRRGRSSGCRSSARMPGSTRRRWPRHPSGRRTARD